MANGVAVARKGVSSDQAQRFLDRAEAVMRKRAAGYRVPEIAKQLHLSRTVVDTIILNRRAGGDPRALTAAAAAVAREAREAEDRAKPPLTGAAAERLATAERIRVLADRAAAVSRNAASCLQHLADLYQHCDRTYPNHTIASEDVFLTKVRPESTIWGGGSPAHACTLVV